jgi:hypothetical protein
VKEAYSITSATVIQRSDLVAHTLEIYSSLRNWFDNFGKIATPPNGVPSSVNDSLYPVVYQYCDSSTATLFCGYYATLIILHEVLKACHYQVDYTEETMALIDNICKSVEYFYSTGTMGPYRLGFSLRVAFEVADTRIKLWIKGWLERFQRFYGAMSVRNYPAIEADDIGSHY